MITKSKTLKKISKTLESDITITYNKHKSITKITLYIKKQKENKWEKYIDKGTNEK